MVVTDAERAEYDDVVRQLMQKLEQLAAENAALKANNASAHQTLRAIYGDSSQPATVRVKAANGAIAYEQPKMGSILPSLGSINRAERWRVFEMWSQRRRYIIEHRAVPPHNWDAHLRPDVYTPPEGDAMPPVDVIDTGSGFKVLTNLLPKSGQPRRIGNDNSGNGSDTAG